MSSEQDNLAVLAAIFPSHSSAVLRHTLVASNNNVERATNALLAGDGALTGPSRKKRKSGPSGLDSWLGIKKEKLAGDASRAHATAEDGAKTYEASGLPRKSAFELLKDHSVPSMTGQKVATTPALPPLTLANPQAVYEHTDGLCELIENVLPKELAVRLYLRMVNDSKGDGADGKPWERNRWYMVDRAVESPHTTTFYVEGPGGDTKSAYDQQAFAEAARYWYNGEQRESKFFNGEMNEARELLTPLIRAVLSNRKRHPLEFDGEWTPNVAAANCYRGAKESVGFHTDVLTYLGPRPTIASLSLGVTRPFRIRAIAPSAPPPGSTSSLPTAPRTYNIPLPHNSLLIMHAGVQEKFKHAIPEVAGMDIFRLPKVEGSSIPSEAFAEAYRERINMTFRFYRPDFAPLPSKSTPDAPQPPPNYVGSVICRCGTPCTLRPDAKGRAKARLTSNGGSAPANGVEEGEDDMNYFWVCNFGAQNEGKTCGHFQLLDMKAEGRGKWWRGEKEV